MKLHSKMQGVAYTSVKPSDVEKVDFFYTPKPKPQKVNRDAIKKFDERFKARPETYKVHVHQRLHPLDNGLTNFGRSQRTHVKVDKDKLKDAYERFAAGVTRYHS